jgi:hypothetical protein
MSALAKVDRDGRLIRRRLAHVEFPVIAEEFGLAESTCKAIFYAWRDSAKPLPETPEDPIAFTYESLGQMAAYQEELAKIMLHERATISERIACVRALTRLNEQMFVQRHASGLTPSRAMLRVQADGQRMFELVRGVLERAGQKMEAEAAEEMLLDLAESLRDVLPQPEAVEVEPPGIGSG